MGDPLHRIELTTGDITTLRVDAVVNAANESLLGGGGVDGAIHRAAGPRLLEHNRTLGGCPTGGARITPSFDLDEQGVRHIIHAVGPVWHGFDEGGGQTPGATRADVLLASCYDESLKLAQTHGAAKVAFPAISTGVYRFPKTRAAKIAVGQALAWLAAHDLPQTIVFCCFGDDDAQIYREALKTLRDG